jgi:hypothetical protein
MGTESEKASLSVERPPEVRSAVERLRAMKTTPEACYGCGEHATGLREFKGGYKPVCANCAPLNGTELRVRHLRHVETMRRVERVERFEQ